MVCTRRVVSTRRVSTRRVSTRSVAAVIRVRGSLLVPSRRLLLSCVCLLLGCCLLRLPVPLTLSCCLGLLLCLLPRGALFVHFVYQSLLAHFLLRELLLCEESCLVLCLVAIIGCTAAPLRPITAAPLRPITAAPLRPSTAAPLRPIRVA